ncbi:MAG: hypothetical protein NW202_13540 [Nitrospira sp.]|nr:hypothetical protein [Nitrospira sp.]
MSYKTANGLTNTLSTENIERFYAQEAERRSFSAANMNALRDAARAGTLTAQQKTTATEIVGQAFIAAMDWS